MAFTFWRVTLTFLKRLKEGKNRTHSENFDHSYARLWEFLASVQLLLSPRNQERMEIRRKWYHHTNSLRLLVWSYIWNGERIWQSGAVQLVCLQKLMPYRGGKCALNVAPLNPQRPCVESVVAGVPGSCHLAIANSSVSLPAPPPPCWANIILFCMCYDVKGSAGMAESWTSLRRFLGNLFLGSGFGGVRGFYEKISLGTFGCCILYPPFGDLQCITIPETQKALSKMPFLNFL